MFYDKICVARFQSLICEDFCVWFASEPDLLVGHEVCINQAMDNPLDKLSPSMTEPSRSDSPREGETGQGDARRPDSDGPRKNKSDQPAGTMIGSDFSPPVRVSFGVSSGSVHAVQRSSHASE